MILDEIVADKREQLFRDKQKTDLTVMRTLAEEKLREEAAKKEIQGGADGRTFGGMPDRKAPGYTD